MAYIALCYNHLRVFLGKEEVPEGRNCFAFICDRSDGWNGRLPEDIRDIRGTEKEGTEWMAGVGWHGVRAGKKSLFCSKLTRLTLFGRMEIN